LLNRTGMTAPEIGTTTATTWTAPMSDGSNVWRDPAQLHLPRCLGRPAALVIVPVVVVAVQFFVRTHREVQEAPVPAAPRSTGVKKDVWVSPMPGTIGTTARPRRTGSVQVRTDLCQGSEV
jgi:hypothetical protein